MILIDCCKLSPATSDPQAISIITSRVNFGSKEDKSFNSIMSAIERSNAISTLLFDRGLGEVLCDKFRTYWKPRIMVRYLEEAATFSRERESTLNITDSIQTKIKELFMDFCIYMLSEINEDFNLDIIYAETTALATHQLFLEVFRTISIPEITQLCDLANNLPALQPPAHCFKFPFFSLVYSLMEKQVELSGEDANRQLNIFANSSHLPESHSKIQALVEAVSIRLKSQQVLSIVTTAMTSDLQLWHCYFNDFIAHKLSLVNKTNPHLPILTGDLAQQILSTYFKYLDKYDATRRMAELHSICQLEIAKTATILRPVIMIGKVNEYIVTTTLY